MRSSRYVTGKWGLRMIDRLPLVVRAPVALAGTLGIVAASLWIRILAEAALPPGVPFISFFPAVILVAVLFGVRYGILAAILCGLAAWHYFLPARPEVAFDPAPIAALGFYAIVAAFVIAIIYWLQRANEHLAVERERNAQLARTRGLLFDELQHRISNNLQAVAGLLALQRRRLVDPQAVQALAEASQRVALVGRISRRLYDNDGTGKGLAAFLTALLDDVVEANGRTDIMRSVDCPNDIRLTTEQALPVALVIAEAIANAIEHGLADHPAPRIEVEVVRDVRGISIAVTDNGGTLPKDFDAAASDSLGLSIATMLARQSGGSFELSGGEKTRACLQLPPA